MTAGPRITAGGVARTVAVVSDGSDTQGEQGADVRSGLLHAAALLREHTGMEATAVLVSAESSEELIAELRGLPADISGVYLVRTDRARGRAAQAALSGTLPVITDRQTLAVAALAATLTTLTRAEVAPDAGHVVIVGAERDRLVAALAVAAGIGEISSWGLEDAHRFPLHVLTRKATVVIDLLGSAAHRRMTDRMTDTLDPPTRVVSVDDPTVTLIALPVLLAAAVSAGRAPDLTACLACAHALAQCTPPDRTLPVLSDPGPGATVGGVASHRSTTRIQFSHTPVKPDKPATAPGPVRRYAMTAAPRPCLDQEPTTESVMAGAFEYWPNVDKTRDDTTASGRGAAQTGNGEPHHHRPEQSRSDGYIRYVTHVIHAIDHHGAGHITMRGPAFIEHKKGIFNHAYALAYDHALLHGFTNTDGVTTWTK